MGLTSRYRRLNQCVAKVATMNSQSNGWSEVHTKLITFYKRFSEHLAELVEL